MGKENRHPLLLMVLDGWGAGPDWEYNAVSRAGLKNYPEWLMRYPNRIIGASGEWVGLPDGQMGNSEVGHLTLGAGRVLFQELPRISREIADGRFYENSVLKAACQSARNSTLHLIGLVSDGGVHSHLEHMKALLRLAKMEGLQRVSLHAVLDGRDTPPTSGEQYIEDTCRFMREEGIGTVATVMGRYWAMDRDQRWERVQKAYAAFVRGEGTQAADPVEAVKLSYISGVTDEFVAPLIFDVPGARIASGDSVIFFNFRADRAREISRALTDEQFSFFPRGDRPAIANYTTFTRYQKDFPFPVAFDTKQPDMTLGEAVSQAGRKQLRIAETEKYAHVTFFFNGGREVMFEGEERILIPSPSVATYDRKPSMSAVEVTEALLARTERDDLDFILLNYANPDMVGHTGYFDAACEAARVVDACAGRVVGKLLQAGWSICVTADHGNLEKMREDDGVTPHTAHTTNPVPLIWIGPEKGLLDLDSHRGLSSIAPTILEYLGIPVPSEMDSASLWD